MTMAIEVGCFLLIFILAFRDIATAVRLDITNTDLRNKFIWLLLAYLLLEFLAINGPWMISIVTAGWAMILYHLSGIEFAAVKIPQEEEVLSQFEEQEEPETNEPHTHQATDMKKTNILLILFLVLIVVLIAGVVFISGRGAA